MASMPPFSQLQEWAISDDEGSLHPLIKWVDLRQNAASAVCRALGLDVERVFIRTMAAVSDEDFESVLLATKYSEPSNFDSMQDLSLVEKSRARSLLSLCKTIFPAESPATPPEEWLRDLVLTDGPGSPGHLAKWVGLDPAAMQALAEAMGSSPAALLVKDVAGIPSQDLASVLPSILVSITSDTTRPLTAFERGQVRDLHRISKTAYSLVAVKSQTEKPQATKSCEDKPPRQDTKTPSRSPSRTGTRKRAHSPMSEPDRSELRSEPPKRKKKEMKATLKDQRRLNGKLQSKLSRARLPRNGKCVQQ